MKAIYGYLVGIIFNSISIGLYLAGILVFDDGKTWRIVLIAALLGAIFCFVMAIRNIITEIETT